MRRLALVGLGLFATIRTASGEDAPAPKGFDVKTVPAPFEGPSEPGEPRVSQGPVPLDLKETLPDALQKPGTLGDTLFATIGGKTLVALSFAGEELRALVDANGDRAFEGEGESFAGKAEPWLQPPSGRRIGTRWKVAGVHVGGQDLVLTVTRRSGGFSGSLTLEGGPRTAPLALEFDDAVPSSVAKPAALDGKVAHAVAVLEGNRVVAVSAAPGADGAMTVVVDLDADNDLSEEGERREAKGEPMTAVVGTETRPVGTRWVVDGLELPGRRGTLRLERNDGVVTANANVTGGRRGRVDVDGKPHVLLLLDGDLDGSYLGNADFWWFGPPGALANGRGSYANMFEGNEAVYRPEGTWRLASVSPDGVARVEAVEKPAPLGEYLERRAERVNRVRWFPMFEAEAAEFARQRGFDRSAPRAEAPAAWRFVLTPKDALAAAKAEGKPLLVDFEADWCVWCKRLDFYTYPDREVAERLAKFTLVKLNTDLAWSDEWKALPAGLPTLVAFDAAGKPVRFTKPGTDEQADRIPGWSPPAEFAKVLDAVHAAATAKGE